MTTNELTPAAALDLVLAQLALALEKSGNVAGAVASAETKLMGSNAPLDSVALTSLIIGVEHELAERYGIRVELADQHAMSRRPSPFRSARSLADYVAERAATV